MLQPQETFDIIFVGGGAAGCVASGKLAAANPSLRILILEAGPHSLNVDTHVQPARYVHNLLNPNKTTKSFTLHVAKPTEAVANREVIVPAGRVLGGGSSVNFMVYTRASASDYDSWEHVYKNPGWGAKDLIPLLKQIESYRLETKNSSHGQEGPIRISFPEDNFGMATQFLDVARSYDKDRDVVDDWSDFKTADGYGRWPKYISDKTGRRSDAAHAFIYSQPENKNIIVRAEARVVRVLFEGTQAIGVEYVGHETSMHQAYASKQVVISAGSFGAPSILERSGIGAANVLRQNDITQLVDLQGVGENYHDHTVMFTQYSASAQSETMDHIFHGTEESLQAHVAEWRKSGKGLIAHNGLDAGFKVRPSLNDVRQMGSEFEKRWEEFYAPFPDRPVMLGGPFAAFGGPTLPSPQGKYFNMLYAQTYPASIGSVHIAHGLNPYGPLNFHHGYFEEESDIEIYRWMYKHLREIARRMPSYRGELLEWHPAFPEGSKVACKAEEVPVDIEAPKLTYTPDDDKAIDDYHRRMVGTAWHALGTCAMKPRNEDGVVDSRLNVYGTTHLKVADLSICPGNVGANTYNTALAIGAKAAILIAEDLGLSTH